MVSVFRYQHAGIEGFRLEIEELRDSGIQGLKDDFFKIAIIPLIPKFLNSQFLN